jgi:hypothetical protein
MVPYLILGDLTVRVDGSYTSDARQYIVRMFVADGEVYDEEFDIASDSDLDTTVMARMAALQTTPDPSIQVDAVQPATDPGHAVVIS